MRDELAQAVAATLYPVVVEEPDGLKPPALVVKWVASAMSPRSGMSEHEYAVECWADSDLQATEYYAARDAMATAVLEVVRKFQPVGSAVERWGASNEERQLGGVTVRIANVSAIVAEASC